MADEDFAGEKTEPATPRKREEARNKGQVARSTDLSTAVLLLGAFILLRVLSTGVVGDVLGVLRHSFDQIGNGGPVNLDAALDISRAAILWVLSIATPIILCLFGIAFLISFFQVGWRVSTQPLNPDPSKINPLKGLKRIASIRGLMRLFFGILKLTIVAVVLVASYFAFIGADSDTPFRALLEFELPGAIRFMVEATSLIGIQAATALLILAILDYTYQRWQMEQDLRMTKQEVKEEQKRMEGDPKIKQKRRAIGQQLALRQIAAEVPKADVVITNPTHFSVALRYDEEQDSAPMCVAKGADHLALRIREIARAHEVPIVEEPPLARSLYATTEPGEPVPENLYEPVAKVLAYVYRLGSGRSKSGSRRTQTSGVS